MVHWYSKRPKRQTKRQEIIQRNAHVAWCASLAPPEKAESALAHAARFTREVPAERARRERDPLAPSEHQVQCAVVTWWNLAHAKYRLPTFALLAIPNGGARDAITGSRLKAEGVRRGVFDLLLAVPTKLFGGLWLEMKVGNNKLTTEQEEFQTYLINADYQASVHWSADSAIKAIEEYLGPAVEAVI